MASFEHQDGYGSLFKNTRRQKSSHPEYTGSLKIHGVEYWIAGWLKDSRNGKYFSLSFKPKDEGGASKDKPAGGGSKAKAGDEPEGVDDEIPF